MVESVTTATAEMALKLSAVNRWCVTGTPISTGVQDLYGLLLFLGVSPFYYKSVSVPSQLSVEFLDMVDMVELDCNQQLLAIIIRKR